MREKVGTRILQTTCGVEATLELIGGKWKGVILYHLSFGTLRFSDLRRRMPGVTQRMLTRQLRELEDDGIVHRKVYPEVPPRVEYSLTPSGETLMPIIMELRNWGDRYLEAQPPAHEAQAGLKVQP